MPDPARSTSSATDVLGATEPRLWTPPLCDLTPETSYGFDVIDFARDVLDAPLDPWQEWVAVHAGELLDDGRPRFRTVLILVARQQGKTHLLKVLCLYWLFVERQKLILGTSTNRDTAKEAWAAAVELAQESPWLAPEIDRIGRATGGEALVSVHGCRYKFAASNRRGGRGLTINRLVLDELREHWKWDAWNASTFATNAVPDAQIFCISNQGDDTSVVLDALRAPAVAHIERGDGDDRLGLFEWSAPDGADPTDPHALAQANPQYGRRTDPATLHGAALRAVEAGGEELAGFRTEVLCQRVLMLDPAIDPDRWTNAGTDTPLDLAGHRDRLALCVDVSLDGSHASLVAATTVDGRVHAEVVEAWEGYGCTKRLRSELPDLVRKVKPRALGWFPGGPAAAVAADLHKRRGWPPRGVELEDIRGDVTAVCMGLADLVNAGEVVHPNDPMLTAHVNAATRLRRGDAWAFARQGNGPIDGCYALAGAVHLARTLPPPRPPLMVV